MELKENKVNKMGSMPVGKLLLSMAWPPTISMSINAFYNIIDSIFVAMLSESSLTAVSLVLPIQILMVAIGVGSGVGVNSLISRRLGEGKVEEASFAGSIGIRLGFVNYLIFAIIGVFFSELFIGGFTNNHQIFLDGVAYLKIISIGSIFFMIQLLTEKIIQSTGNMISSMIITLTGALVNLALDPILIFGLLGFPKMGVTGAAIATVIGQGIAAILGVYLAVKHSHGLIIRLYGFKMEWRIIKDIYSVGLPAIIMQSISSIMVLGYNAILATSPTAVAVLGIYFRLQSIIFMPVFGMNQAAMPIMGYNYGAKNKHRLMETYIKSLIAVTVIMAIGMVMFQVIPNKLLILFSASENMVAIGVPALRIISLCFIPAAFGIMTSTIFQATGYGSYSLMASILRQLVGILPIAYFLMLKGGPTASWYSFPLAEMLGFCLSAILLRKLYKENISNLDK
ncbi:MATE family efflux transporter [Eubacteriales bacterium KG127]